MAIKSRIINAYIPLPTIVRYLGFKNGASIRIWLFKDNKYVT